MYRCEFSNYVGSDIAIVGDSDGFGAVSRPDDTVLIKPTYYEVLLITLKVKTLLVYEKKRWGMIIGIYSVNLRQWLHSPQFTNVTIKDSHTLWVWVGVLKGECDITTGDISWHIRK